MGLINSKGFKTAVISTHDCVNPSWGGGGSRTLKISLELAKRNLDVYLIAPLEERVSAEGIRSLHVRQPSKKYSFLLSTLRFNFQVLIKLFSLPRRVDLVITHNCVAALGIPFLKKIFSFRFVIDITDIHTGYIYMEDRKLFNRVVTPFLEKIEYSIIKSADLVIVVSLAMKELLIAKGVRESIIKIVPDGAELGKLSLHKREGAEERVLHLGAMDVQHNAEIVVKAIPYILKTLPSVKFLFVGGGRKLNEIRKKSIELGVEENCLFTGPLPQEKAREYLQESIIGIIPRRKSPANDLVTTLKIFEYWASGTAVVSSPLKAITEIASDGVNILFFDGSEQDLAEKILFLFRNQKLRSNIVKRAREDVDKFDVDKSARDIVDFTLN